MKLQEKRKMAHRAFKHFLDVYPNEENEAAQAAWEVLRVLNPRLRAPWWLETFAVNSANRKAYRCPLAEELKLDVPSI